MAWQDTGIGGNVGPGKHIGTDTNRVGGGDDVIFIYICSLCNHTESKKNYTLRPRVVLPDNYVKGTHTEYTPYTPANTYIGPSRIMEHEIYI